jgi:rRNA processing protein Krr1/Pno1
MGTRQYRDNYKMKFIVILATCLGLSFAAPQPFSLVDDIDDFLNLIDLNEIDTLLKDNLQDNIQYRYYIFSIKS